jgi:hypothetical protein
VVEEKLVPLMKGIWHQKAGWACIAPVHPVWLNYTIQMQRLTRLVEGCYLARVRNSAGPFDSINLNEFEESVEEGP